MDRYRKIIAFVFGSILFCFTAIGYAVEVPSHSPIGYWKIIDKVSGKPTSIVQIWKTSDQHLMGKIVKVFAETHDPTRCSACQGLDHDQPVVGLVILSGLKNNENQWNNGKILDPDNGKIYSCTLRLTEDGKKLNVHGYIGLPLFGRSQIWERVDLLSSEYPI